MKEIYLKTGETAFVDDTDFEVLKNYKWYLSNSGSAQTYVQRKSYHIGHFILTDYGSKHTNFEVDHINRNPLDNRRCNLRLCTKTQNAQNRKKRSGCKSFFKGLFFNKKTDLWQTRITINKKRISLGYFKNELDAALAYDSAALKYFGEFACTNSNLGLT